MKGYEFERLYVKDGKIWPNDVDVIEGFLNLNCSNISKIENIPKIIKGYLDLGNNNIFKIENLPKVIEGDLFLYNNPIYKQFLKTNFKNVKKWAYYIQRLQQWVKEWKVTNLENCM